MAEVQRWSNKSLCYFCDAKSSPSHHCPNRQYLFLIAELEDDHNPNLTTDFPDHTVIDVPSLPTNTDDLNHHLSFNALKGSHSLGTLRFTGTIKGTRVQILLDSGSSDNFLQPRLA